MVHAFRFHTKGKTFFFLWDIESGSLHSVDDVAFLCAKHRYALSMTKEEQEVFSVIPENIKGELEEEFQELEQEGTLNAAPYVRAFVKRAAEIKAMCLHICHDCNLNCDYCFAGGGTYHTARDYMSAEVGKKAIDLLISESGARKNLEVDFFGGEPLMNLSVVKEIVDYAKAEAEKRGKVFTFTMTTNCVLLNQDTIDYLNREMDNVVLSIDGRASVHNCVRHARNGKDVYDLILKNALAFRKVRGDKRYYVRGTFTAKNLDFSKDIFALTDCGFDQISVEPVVLPDEHPLALLPKHIPAILEEYDRLAEGYLERRKGEKWFNFFHFMIDLHHGPCINKRLTGCGAGTEYLAVSPTGDLYPCHQFVGEEDYRIGSVFTGIERQEIRDKFSEVTVLKKEHCKECPAKYYCGGGCAANAKNFTGKIDGQYKMGCELTKKRMELSLALAYLEERLEEDEN